MTNNVYAASRKKPYHIKTKTVYLTVGEKYPQKLIKNNGKTIKARKIRWKSRRPSVAKITKKGIITGVKAGTAKMTAKYKGSTYNFTVVVKKETPVIAAPVPDKTTIDKNLFCIPGFSYPTSTDFRFYIDNPCLKTNLFSQLESYSEDKAYADGYSIQSPVEESRSYTLNIIDESSNKVVESCYFNVDYRSKNIRDITALFIGDSIINSGRITQKASDIFSSEGATLTLLGQRGTTNNKHQGMPGWTAESCWSKASYNDCVNHFYNPAAGHFDFNYYMTTYGYSSPDFVFIQFGINDLFYVSPYNYEVGYTTYKNAMLNIINDIHAYDSNIKIVVNMITLPNESEDVFRAMYGNSISREDRRLMDIIANNKLIKDMPDYVILNPHHLVLDSATMIRDDVHPTQVGFDILGTLDANVMFVN